jgi:hypothetical protein
MEQLLSLIVTASVGFLSACLGSLVAINKFKKEKNWERKEKAYIEIIDSLYDLLQHCEIHKEDYGQGTGFTEEKEEEFRQRFNVAFWKIKKATDIGAFVISKEAHAVLSELNSREKLNWNENPIFEIYEHEYSHFQKALQNLVAIAKNELHEKNV